LTADEIPVPVTQGIGVPSDPVMDKAVIGKMGGPRGFMPSDADILSLAGAQI